MLTRKLTAMGLWPQAFMDIDAAVAAAGTDLATATQLRTAIAVVTTGTGGVKLPKGGEPGDEVLVVNSTVASINVYPEGTDTINGAQTAIAVAAAAGKRFVCTVEGKWISFTPA